MEGDRFEESVNIKIMMKNQKRKNRKNLTNFGIHTRAKLALSSTKTTQAQYAKFVKLLHQKKLKSKQLSSRRK